MPVVYEIAGSGLKSVANLLLNLWQQNEMEKHGRSNEIKCQMGTETRRTMWDIVEEIVQRLESLTITGDGEYQCERKSWCKL